MASKSFRIDVSKILPDDDEMLSRNLQLRKLFTKYSAPDKNNDDMGFTLDDALKRYMAEGDDEDSSLASEVVSDEEDAAETDPPYDYEDVRKQRTLLVKEKNEQWEKNGLGKILNDVCFKLSTTFVDDWLKRNCPNTSKHLAMNRESRITKHDGDTTLDIHNKSNLTVQNDDNRQCLATALSSNYEVSGNNTKVVIHQVEKTTLTTIFTDGSNGASFSLNNLAGKSFDLHGLSTFAGFKIPDPVGQLRCISMGAPKPPKVLTKTDVAHVGNSARKANVGSRNIVDREERVVKKTVNEPFLAVKKLTKAATVKTAPSISSNEENEPSTEQHRRLRRTRSKVRKQIRSSSSSDSDRNVKKLPIQQNLVNDINKRSFLKSSKSKSIFDAHAPRLNQSNNQTIMNDTKSVTTKEEDSILISSDSDESDRPTHTRAKHGIHQKLHSKSHDKMRQKPPGPVRSEKYIMSLECQKQLTEGGRLRYNTEGTVIYRPQHVQPDLPKDAKKIEITMADLDLSAVSSELKRKKFNDFKRRIHPNSTVVYFMSESEEDKNNEDGELSDEEDDILSSFCPIVVYEYAYQGV